MRRYILAPRSERHVDRGHAQHVTVSPAPPYLAECGAMIRSPLAVLETADPTVPLCYACRTLTGAPVVIPPRPGRAYLVHYPVRPHHRPRPRQHVVDRTEHGPPWATCCGRTVPGTLTAAPTPDVDFCRKCVNIAVRFLPVDVAR